MVFLAMNLVQISSAREWVSVYGRALIADFVSATETDVTLTRLSDKKEFIIPLSTLSDIDQKWVADHKGEADPTKDPTQDKGTSGLRLGLGPEQATSENPYAKLFTGAWALAEYRDLPYAVYVGADLDPSKKYPGEGHGITGKVFNDEKALTWLFEQKRDYLVRPLQVMPCKFCRMM
jgi:hypothetical protein